MRKRTHILGRYLICIILGAYQSLCFAYDNPQFDNILNTIQEGENQLSSLQLSMTEHVTDYIHKEGSVSRFLQISEQGSMYRLETDYPDVKEPPKAPGNLDDNARYPYFKSATAYDGKILLHHIPCSRLGYRDKGRFIGQTDAIPTTTRYPFSPYSQKSYREFLISQANKANAEIDVVEDYKGNINHVLVEIKTPGKHWSLVMDKSKGFCLLESTLYQKGQLAEHRLFSKYEQKDGIWMAKEIRIEMYHNVTNTIGKLILSKMGDDWIPNKPISEDTFTIKFPEGTHIKDFILQTSYLIDTHHIYRDSNVINALANIEGNLEDRLDNIEKTVSHDDVNNISHSNQTLPANNRELEGAITQASSNIGDWIYLLWKPFLLLFIVAIAGPAVCLVFRKILSSKGKIHILLKRIIVYSWGILLVICGLNAIFIIKYARTGPAIQLESQSFNLGVIPAEIDHELKVVLRNVGTNILNIKDIKKSCTCSAVNIDRQVIPPGESAAMNISYTPKRSMRDEFETSVTFRTNDHQNQSVQVNIYGQSVPEVEVSEANINVGTLCIGTRKQVNVKIYQPMNGIVSLKSQPGDKLTDNVVLEQVKNFHENTGKSGLEITLSVSPSRQGEWRENVEIPVNLSNDPSGSDILVVLYGNANDAVNAYPSIVSLEIPEESKKEVIIHLNGLIYKSKGLSIDVSPPLLDVSLSKNKYDNNSSALKAILSVKQDKYTYPVDGRIVIRSNESDTVRTKKIIPFIIRKANTLAE